MTEYAEVPYNAAPGSEAEARAIRAIEAYYERYSAEPDPPGRELYRQCVSNIIESGDDAVLSTAQGRTLVNELTRVLRLMPARTTVDLAAVLGIIPSFDAWGRGEE